MTSTPRLFINYRSEDIGWFARYLNSVLLRELQSDQIFIDGSIQPGEKWPDRLKQEVERCTVFFLLIGPNWEKVQDEHGERCLSLPNDWVRLEIETALSKANRSRVPTIIPVFVDRVEVDPKTYPDSLRVLADLNALHVRGKPPGLDQDIQTIRQLLQRQHGFKPSAVWTRLAFAVLMLNLAFGILAFGYFLLVRSDFWLVRQVDSQAQQLALKLSRADDARPWLQVTALTSRLDDVKVTAERLQPRREALSAIAQVLYEAGRAQEGKEMLTKAMISQDDERPPTRTYLRALLLEGRVDDAENAAKNSGTDARVTLAEELQLLRYAPKAGETAKQVLDNFGDTRTYDQRLPFRHALVVFGKTLQLSDLLTKTDQYLSRLSLNDKQSVLAELIPFLTAQHPDETFDCGTSPPGDLTSCLCAAWQAKGFMLAGKPETAGPLASQAWDCAKQDAENPGTGAHAGSPPPYTEQPYLAEFVSALAVTGKFEPTTRQDTFERLKITDHKARSRTLIETAETCAERFPELALDLLVEARKQHASARKWRNRSEFAARGSVALSNLGKLQMAKNWMADCDGCDDRDTLISLAAIKLSYEKQKDDRLKSFVIDFDNHRIVALR